MRETECSWIPEVRRWTLRPTRTRASGISCLSAFFPEFVRGASIIILIALITPGAAEVAENVWHFLSQGHEAHAAEFGADHRETDDEHGCTPLGHLCGCHQASADREPAPVLAKSQDVRTSPIRPLTSSKSLGAAGSIDHPPRLLS